MFICGQKRFCGKISTVNKEIDLWHFVRDRLEQNQPVMLLVVADSAGSSPGRQGYKMAVVADGELCGSIGGGLMEVKLVELAKGKSKKAKGKNADEIVDQVHRKDALNASGMICSGKQTVIFKQITSDDLQTVKTIIDVINTRKLSYLIITPTQFRTWPAKVGTSDDFTFKKLSDTDFIYEEEIGKKSDLYIIGGGHCALALSELMSKMDFHIRIFDDRPQLNTIEKNKFADEITIIDAYERIGELIRAGSNVYVVLMTLGYSSDEVVIRQLINHDLKYFGVLGSKAKMKTLLTALEKDGFAKEKLDRIHAPIGLSINSRTPEEIAVSIAAEIISVKNP